MKQFKIKQSKTTPPGYGIHTATNAEKKSYGDAITTVYLLATYSTNETVPPLKYALFATHIVKLRNMP